MSPLARSKRAASAASTSAIALRDRGAGPDPAPSGDRDPVSAAPGSLTGRCRRPGNRVRISTPSSVTATVCSHCADSLRSLVTTVQPSGSSLVWRCAFVDHRLDGEGHARLQHQAFAGAAVMQHLRILVVDLADAVAAVLAHHAEALGLGVLLDRVADVAQGRARLDGADAAEHRLAGHVDQALGHHRRRAGEVHAAGVAVPAVLDDGDVDIDDVAVLQDLGFARDAVADDVVDRGADRGREALVADVGRDRLLHVDDVVVADAVQLGGGHAGLHVRGDDLQHLGGQAAGDAHLLDLVRGLDGDGHRRIIAHVGGPFGPPIGQNDAA